ncbi:MAG: hypothetical protein [Inoviridae sp.]|nr:MAG: hypothetical protein [Inoviridae sp.]
MRYTLLLFISLFSFNTFAASCMNVYNSINNQAGAISKGGHNFNFTITNLEWNTSKHGYDYVKGGSMMLNGQWIGLGDSAHFDACTGEQYPAPIVKPIFCNSATAKAQMYGLDFDCKSKKPFGYLIKKGSSAVCNYETNAITANCQYIPDPAKPKLCPDGFAPVGSGLNAHCPKRCPDGSAAGIGGICPEKPVKPDPDKPVKPDPDKPVKPEKPDYSPIINSIKSNNDLIKNNTDVIKSSISDNSNNIIAAIKDNNSNVQKSIADIKGSLNTQDCNSFSCSGVPALCYLAKQKWKESCSKNDDSKGVGKLQNTLENIGKTGDKQLQSLNNPSQDITGALNHYNDSNGFHAASDGCPAPQIIDLKITKLTIDYSPFCDLAVIIRWFVISFASIGSVLFVIKNI